MTNFEKLCGNDKTLLRLKKLAQQEGSNLDIAYQYAQRISKLAHDYLRGNNPSSELTTQVLNSSKKLSDEIYEFIQENVMKKNGLGLGVLKAKPNKQLANKIVEMVENDDYTEETFLEHAVNVVDRNLLKNADSLSKIGVKNYLVRTYSDYGLDHAKKIHYKDKTYDYGDRYVRECEFCKSLEGTYNYPDDITEDKNPFARHKGCSCEIKLYLWGKEINI